MIKTLDVTDQMLGVGGPKSCSRGGVSSLEERSRCEWDQAGGAGPELEDLLVGCRWVPPEHLPSLPEECDLGVQGRSEY